MSDFLVSPVEVVPHASDLWGQNVGLSKDPRYLCFFIASCTLSLQLCPLSLAPPMRTWPDKPDPQCHEKPLRLDFSVPVALLQALHRLRPPVYVSADLTVVGAVSPGPGVQGVCADSSPSSVSSHPLSL